MTFEIFKYPKRFFLQDYEHIGRAFCETLMDYSDENPIKVKKRERIKKILKRMRKKERKLRKAAKLEKKLAKERQLMEFLVEGPTNCAQKIDT